MAGFFLTRTDDNNIKINKALHSFAEDGLKNPSEYSCGDYTLYLFDKITAKEPYIAKTEKGFCAAVGAFIYKGLSYTQSLKMVIEDFLNRNLDYSEMYGQYTLILFVDNMLLILPDALSTKHIFSDRQYSFFSSSFFAAASAIGNVSINDMAVYEKMLTGIIISPDTLINEVIQINKNEQKRINDLNCGVTFLIHPQIKILPKHHQGRKLSVISQAQNIRKYFSAIRPALGEERVDLGLSAGHDSSLIFAAMNSMYKDNLHIHTHSTGHVHDKEKNAAIAMAKIKGLKPTIVPTPRLDESGIDLNNILYENLLFFDGRTSHDIGGFSATYRAKYRLMATDGCQSTLSGIGGECFRNHYSVKGNRMNAERFFTDKVFSRCFIDAIPHELFEKVMCYHLKKAEKVLQVKLRGKTDRLHLRRYYSEILMADGQGNVIDAYNTVSKCIAPFLDPHILQEAYRGIKYLGNCGEYESSIICELDPEIGECINANNGYPFSHIPIKLRIKEAIRTFVSSRTWENLNWIRKKNKHDQSNTYFFDVLSKSEKLSNAFNELKDKYPIVDFNKAIQGYAMDALIEYLALTIRKLKNEQKCNQ